jgi:hypothetical protein
VFDKFPKYCTRIFFIALSAKVGKEDIFKQTIGNKTLNEISNDNGVRAINSATSKNLRVKSAMFPHRNIYKYIWSVQMGKPTVRLAIFW